MDVFVWTLVASLMFDVHYVDCLIVHSKAIPPVGQLLVCRSCQKTTVIIDHYLFMVTISFGLGLKRYMMSWENWSTQSEFYYRQFMMVWKKRFTVLFLWPSAWCCVLRFGETLTSSDGVILQASLSSLHLGSWGDSDALDVTLCTSKIAQTQLHDSSMPGHDSQLVSRLKGARKEPCSNLITKKHLFDLSERCFSW